MTEEYAVKKISLHAHLTTKMVWTLSMDSFLKQASLLRMTFQGHSWTLSFKLSGFTFLWLGTLEANPLFIWISICQSFNLSYKQGLLDFTSLWQCWLVSQNLAQNILHSRQKVEVCNIIFTSAVISYNVCGEKCEWSVVFCSFVQWGIWWLSSTWHLTTGINVKIHFAHDSTISNQKEDCTWSVLGNWCHWEQFTL